MPNVTRLISADDANNYLNANLWVNAQKKFRLLPIDASNHA